MFRQFPYNMHGSKDGSPQGVGGFSGGDPLGSRRGTTDVYSRSFLEEVLTPVAPESNPPAVPPFEVFMLNATVSGSFHRHMDGITSAVHELASLNVRVLSPADPRIVAAQGDFLFVASDPIRSVRLVQDRHLESIKAANFLWLVCPDGYVGQSAAMEIGYAAAVGVPIFAARLPTDLTLRQYVKLAASLKTAVNLARISPNRRPSEGILIDPHASIERAHRVLDYLSTALVRPGNTTDLAVDVYRGVASLRQKLSLPVQTQ